MIVTAGSTELTLIEGAAAHSIVRLAEQAHLPEHFASITAQLEAATGESVSWKPFGGEGRVAHSALGAAAESTHLLSEPVINMIDAALEMAYLLAVRRGEPFEPQSMAEAARRWFDVPEAGLPAWDVRAGEALTRFQALARRSAFLIRPGSTVKMPTAVFLDCWLGQHPADQEGTVLSLQRGLKADVPFLAGQYGHGAGFTLAFSHGGQILLSRRHPDLLAPGYADLVGLSLVERRMPSQTGHNNPTYWYAVCPKTETPYAFSPETLSDPRWHGLRRTCLNYEMHRSSERDIYSALDHNITNPALPYALRDERGGEGEARQFRLMSGNTARLERAYSGRRPRRPGKNEILLPHRRTSRIDLDAWIGDGRPYGFVEVTTTVVRQEGTNRGNELYVPAKEAEAWTLNGQRHHARSRLHFGQEPIRLDALRDHLIVEVRLDGLSPDAKALTLTTDRQGAAEREVRFQLEAAIDNLLGTDPELRALDKAAREEALRQAASSRMADLDRELTQFDFFVRKERVHIRVRKTIDKIKRQRAPKVELNPISPLHSHPTFLRFRKKLREVLRVAPGATTSVLIEADAVDGYFDVTRQPTFTFHPAVGSALQVYATDELRHGRMRVRIKARSDAALGATALIATYLPPSAAAPLTTQIAVEIAERSPRKRGGDGRKRTVYEKHEEERALPPAYQIVFADRSPRWEECGLHHWTEETVGEYRNDVAYVNGSYRPVTRLLREVKPSQHHEYLTLYLAPIIMTLVGFAKEEANPPKDEETGEAVALHESYRSAALQGAALSAIFTIRKLRKLGMGDESPEEE